MESSQLLIVVGLFEGILVGWFLESRGGKPSQTTPLAGIQIKRVKVL